MISLSSVASRRQQPSSYQQWGAEAGPKNAELHGRRRSCSWTRLPSNREGSISAARHAAQNRILAQRTMWTRRVSSATGLVTDANSNSDPRLGVHNPMWHFTNVLRLYTFLALPSRYSQHHASSRTRMSRRITTQLLYIMSRVTGGPVAVK